MRVPEHWPVLGICGFSGAGKTTLVERLLPRLVGRGLAVAVVKHDAHRLTLDTTGKDTDRFFRAGATVVAHDPTQAMIRWRPDHDRPLVQALARLLTDHDLVLVEGHKETALPAKVWLENEQGEPPLPAGPWLARLDRHGDRVTAVARLLADWLPAQQRRQPLRAGILVGGASRRMGRPKQLLLYRDRPWILHVADALRAHAGEVCLLGDGEVPDDLTGSVRIPDAPGREGPLAGMLAALRWDPRASWLVAACDMPLLDAEALGWLLEGREPGCWAILPRRPGTGHVEPLGAWYDHRLAGVLERGDRPRLVADHPRVHVAEVPAAHAAAWRSFNTPGELAELG